MNINWDQVFDNYQALETERCLLRPPTMDDADAIFDIMSDETVTQYLGRFPMKTHDEAVQQVDRYLTGLTSQSSMSWIICNRDDMTVIGTVSLFSLNKEHCRAELGYILGPQWWGKGIMSEIIRAAVDFGFDKMVLHSLMAQIDPDNGASKRLLEKFGFVQEAYFREDFYHPVEQKFTDTAVFSLLKSDWKR